jgi:N6-L-threonylcarbamoyladenine synthase
MGALLVGLSFAKGLSLATKAPLIEVNHLQGHVLSHFIDEKDQTLPHPAFPFLCLLVSGGHTQILKVDAPLQHSIMGQTLDDAAGEAFDKCAKLMGLPYPGGPTIDQLAAKGDARKFTFAKPRVPGLDYSFSGLKTSFLYFLQKEIRKDPQFIVANKPDLCASLQLTIIQILLQQLILAAKQTGITQIAVAGGVSANSGLRHAVQQEGVQRNWKVYLPPLRYTTDNAAMIAVAGYYKLQKQQFAPLDVVARARM